MPHRLDHGIGVVGAGGVVNYAHLPAYAKAGFKVVAIMDKDRQRAEQTAGAHKIPKVYSTVEELVRDPEVEVVDIAVYPWEALAIAEAGHAGWKTFALPEAGFGGVRKGGAPRANGAGGEG